MNELKEKFFDRLRTENSTPLEGYIELEEIKGDKDTTIGVRVPDKLAERFDMAIKLEGSTKSKVLRSLIEFYIVESERERKQEHELMAKMLDSDFEVQMEYLESLTPEQREYFFDLKAKRKKNLEKEQKINENK